MKNFITTVAMTLVATAAFAQQSVGYTVKGTSPADVKKVYVIEIGSRKMHAVDSVSVVNGKFTINGKAEKDALLALTPRLPHTREQACSSTMALNSALIWERRSSKALSSTPSSTNTTARLTI